MRGDPKTEGAPGSDNDPVMPEGNGDKNCPKCRGRGVIPLDLGGLPGGATQNCICVFRRDLTANVKRVWPVLLAVESVESSPLLGMARQSLWITATNYTLRRHLRYVAFRMGTQWDARVIADATLMTAWLSTAKDVRDPDVLTERESQKGKRRTPSDDFQTLVDLVVPFDLLIIRLGVKAAANKEMANVLAEALHERDQIGRPTWVSDDPERPLAHGHRCYSPEVMEILSGFRRVLLQEQVPTVVDPVSAYKPHEATRTAVGSAPETPRIPVPKTPTATPVSPVLPAMTPNLYAPKSVTIQEVSMAPLPGVRPATPKILLVDDDPYSVDALMTNAHTPELGTGQTETEPEVEGTEVASDFPMTYEDIVGSGRPSGVPTGLLAAARKNRGGA